MRGDNMSSNRIMRISEEVKREVSDIIQNDLKDPRISGMISVTKAKANEILLSLKTGISMKLMEGKLNLPVDVAQKIALDVSFTNRTLFNPSKSFMYFLNPGLSAAISQSGIVLLGTLTIINEELPKGKRKKFKYFMSKAITLSIAGTLSIISGVIIQSMIFKVPFNGDLLTVLALCIPYTLAVSLFSFTISLLVPEKLFSLLINAVLFVPSTVLVGYTWPVFSMPTLYKLIAKVHPFYYFASNMRDIYLKGAGFTKIVPSIIWLTKFSLVFMLISAIFMCFYDNKHSGKISMNGGETYEFPL
jgi:ABC-2 type transport system permease protein